MCGDRYVSKCGLFIMIFTADLDLAETYWDRFFMYFCKNISLLDPGKQNMSKTIEKYLNYKRKIIRFFFYANFRCH